MEADRLFVHTLRDLEQRTTATDEYTVLMSAALLRKLLLDSNPLVVQASRDREIRISFRISSISPFEQIVYDNDPLFWIIEDALDPESNLAYRPYDATLKQFLKRRVMRFEGSWITIGDVISQLANVAGAVHNGRARNERQEALQAAEAFYSRAGLPGAVSQVRLIGRITVRGLSQLRDAVVAAGAATWASVSPGGSVELTGDNQKEFTEDNGNTS